MTHALASVSSAVTVWFVLLLVAMIGAIVLTHRKTAGDHRGQQDIAKQNRRNPNEATVMKRPTVGEGVEL